MLDDGLDADGGLPPPTRDWRYRGRAFVLDSIPAAGAIALKLASAFCSFLVIVIVARTSGAAVTGDYAMAMATAALASLVATLGLDQITTRLIGGDLREGREDLAWAVLMAAVRIVAPLAICAALIVAVAASLAPLIGASTEAMRLIALSIAAFPLLRLAVVTLRATGLTLLSQFMDGAHSFVILAVISVLYVNGIEVKSTILAALYSLNIVILGIAAWGILIARTRGWPKDALFDKPLLSSSWPVLLSGSTQSLASWIVLAQMGEILGTEEVGAYRVASQIGMTIALVLTTIETLVNPQLAGDFRQKNHAAAWARHRRATALMFVTAVIPVTLCLTLPTTILRLFGPEFLIATNALIVIGCAQLINILTGPIGGLMVMSGHERVSLQLSVIALVLVVVSSFLLIPQFGLLGAALANASGLAFRNIGAYVIMRRLVR